VLHIGSKLPYQLNKVYQKEHNGMRLFNKLYLVYLVPWIFVPFIDSSYFRTYYVIYILIFTLAMEDGLYLYGVYVGKNNEKLLALLSDVLPENRTARFVSVITMVYPNGRKIVARGECEGHMIYQPKGHNGFGYDPLFVPVGYERTFAELSGAEKNQISHRAIALQNLRKKLMEEGV